MTVALIGLRGEGCGGPNAGPTTRTYCDEANNIHIELRPGYCAPIPRCSDGAPAEQYYLSSEFALNVDAVAEMQAEPTISWVTLPSPPSWMLLRFFNPSLSEQAATPTEAARLCATADARAALAIQPSGELAYNLELTAIKPNPAPDEAATVPLTVDLRVAETLGPAPTDFGVVLEVLPDPVNVKKVDSLGGYAVRFGGPGVPARPKVRARFTNGSPNEFEYRWTLLEQEYDGRRPVPGVSLPPQQQIEVSIQPVCEPWMFQVAPNNVPGNCGEHVWLQLEVRKLGQEAWVTREVELFPTSGPVARFTATLSEAGLLNAEEIDSTTDVFGGAEAAWKGRWWSASCLADCSAGHPYVETHEPDTIEDACFSKAASGSKFLIELWVMTLDGDFFTYTHVLNR